jgi:hypothetical protein
MTVSFLYVRIGFDSQPIRTAYAVRISPWLPAIFGLLAGNPLVSLSLERTVARRDMRGTRLRIFPTAGVIPAVSYREPMW